jgi:hypothetical protein
MRAGIGASVLLVAGAIVLAAVGGGSDTPSASAPRVADRAALIDLEAELGEPIYWAGDRPPMRTEVEVEEDGSTYVRYLPRGAEPGDPPQTFLTVGTYPVAGAVAALRRVAAGAGAELGPGGAVFLRNPSAEGSVYLAYPGTDIQIEVYDPAPGRALRLIRSGAIKPVGE